MNKYEEQTLEEEKIFTVCLKRLREIELNSTHDLRSKIFVSMQKENDEFPSLWCKGVWKTSGQIYC